MVWQEKDRRQLRYGIILPNFLHILISAFHEIVYEQMNNEYEETYLLFGPLKYDVISLMCQLFILRLL